MAAASESEAKEQAKEQKQEDVNDKNKEKDKENTVKSFADLVAENNLIYSPKQKMQSKEPSANPHAVYHACFRAENEDKMAMPFEIRYSIYPNMNSSADSARFFFSTFIANISQNMNIIAVMGSIKPFPAQDVKDEFNADYGFTTWCNIDDKWSEEFDKAMVNAIGCNNGAFVVISILFKHELLQNNLDFLQNGIMPSFYDLKFKVEKKDNK